MTLLALLDVSTTFDYVDHDILLERLRRSFGDHGTALSWLESFIRGSTQNVAIRGRRSGWRAICFGVPQGSAIRVRFNTSYSYRKYRRLSNRPACVPINTPIKPTNTVI